MENIKFDLSCENVEDFIKKTWKEKDNDQELVIDSYVEEFPHNSSMIEVWTKVTLINSLYSTNIYDTYSVAKRIIENKKFDELVLSEDVSCREKAFRWIEESKLGTGENTRRLTSFASKYCSFHNKEGYAIYDQYVVNVLAILKKQGKVSYTSQESLKKPIVLKEVLEKLKESEKSDISLKTLDKYLWSIGKGIEKGLYNLTF